MLSLATPLKAWGVALALAALPATTARADDTLALSGLVKQVTSDLKALRELVRAEDEARLFVLQKTAEEADQAIKATGLGNLKTLHTLRFLVVRFKYSDQFFDFVRTKANGPIIDRMLAEAVAVDGSSIRRIIGFDQDPSGRILAENLEAMRTSLTNLLARTDVDTAARSRIQGLMPQLGNVLAKADAEGDRPEAFQAAQAFYLNVRALYPVLDSMAGSSQLFALTLEIRGVNEFIGEYAQVRDGPVLP